MRSLLYYGGRALPPRIFAQRLSLVLEYEMVLDTWYGLRLSQLVGDKVPEPIKMRVTRVTDASIFFEDGAPARIEGYRLRWFPSMLAYNTFVLNTAKARYEMHQQQAAMYACLAEGAQAAIDGTKPKGVEP